MLVFEAINPRPCAFLKYTSSDLVGDPLELTCFAIFSRAFGIGMKTEVHLGLTDR